MKQIILYILIFPISVVAFAQQENTLHFMNTIPQHTYNNPAFMPQYNGYFGLPGISSVYISEFNSGFSYDDIIERREDDSLVIRPTRLNNVLKDRNFIVNEQQVDILSMGARASARLYINFNITAKNYEVIEYPNDITAFFVDGNSEFVGETMNFKFDGDGMAYLEAGLGASYQINRQLTIGAKFKYLNGIVNANTEKAEFSLFTDEFYQLTVSGDVDIKTSGLNQLSEEDFDPDVNDYTDYLKNTGYAVDLGATYDVTEHISIGASILNLGSITWNNDNVNYTLEKDISEFTWEGLDVEKLINEEDELDELLDSLEASFDFIENEDAAAYKTPVPTKVYVSGSYRLPSNAQIGLALFGEKFQDILQGGVGVVVNKKFGKIFDLSFSYSARKDNYNNLGAGFALRLPPFQIYAVSDNLLGAPIYPNSIKSVNLRLGINMVFDWYKQESAIPNSQM